MLCCRYHINWSWRVLRMPSTVEILPQLTFLVHSASRNEFLIVSAVKSGRHPWQRVWLAWVSSILPWLRRPRSLSKFNGEIRTFLEYSDFMHVWYEASACKIVYNSNATAIQLVDFASEIPRQWSSAIAFHHSSRPPWWLLHRACLASLGVPLGNIPEWCGLFARPEADLSWFIQLLEVAERCERGYVPGYDVVVKLRGRDIEKDAINHDSRSKLKAARGVFL